MQKTTELLERLCEAQVDLVIIGGVAAIAHGACTFTQDLDITAPFTTDNMARLLAAVQNLTPRHALAPDRHPLERSPERLATYENLYILTTIGRLDVMGEESVGPFETVRDRAVTMQLGSHRCAVMELNDLIDLKSSLGREKDKLVLMELRAIRDRLRNP